MPQWPELCGRIASSLTSSVAVVGLEQFDRHHADDAEFGGEPQRQTAAASAPGRHPGRAPGR